jgi:hypothetical protein
MAAAENLAGLLGSIGKIDEAIALREMILADMSKRLPNDDPRLMMYAMASASFINVQAMRIS